MTKEEVKKAVKEITPLIEKYMQGVGEFELTKDSPEEPNFEIILQILDGQPEEVEKALPYHLQMTIRSYRYQKFRLFLEINIMDHLIEVESDWLQNIDVGRVIINDLAVYNPAIRGKGHKHANLLFLPPITTFPENIQEQCRWFNERNFQYSGFARFLNLDKPAAQMKFQKRHQYAINKNYDPDKVKVALETDLARLEEELESGKSASTGRTLSERALEGKSQEYAKYAKILENIDDYKFTSSNYERGHIYLFMNYRYTKPGVAKSEDRGLDQVQVSERRMGNFIFLDQELIKTKLSNRHKMNHKYLSSQDRLFSVGKMDYYYRKKTVEEREAEKLEKEKSNSSDSIA